MREPRLGDIIDDYCVKCKRIMNHAVVSLLNGEPAKVRCRTCHNDHDYRHEQPPPPKVDTRKQALFNEVLAKVAPGSTAAAVGPDPILDPVLDDPVLDDPPEDLPPEEEPPLEEEPPPEKEPPPEEEPPPEDELKPKKAKAKSKVKAKGHK